jgi:uncharacterized membrane protein YhhN
MLESSIGQPGSTIIALGILAIPLLLTTGFWLGTYNADRTRRILRPFKMTTSFILVMCAAILWMSSTRLGEAARLLFFGMTFGFLGDLILAGLIRLPNRLMSGMIAFSIGHILYILGFVQTAKTLGLNDPLSGSWLWPAYLVGAGVLWMALVHSRTAPRVLNVGSLVYAGLIGVMAGAATGLAVQDARFWPSAIGGLLFLLSDVILGNRELRHNPWFLVHEVIWVTYISGQALIVLTTAWV